MASSAPWTEKLAVVHVMIGVAVDTALATVGAALTRTVAEAVLVPRATLTLAGPGVAPADSGPTLKAPFL